MMFKQYFYSAEDVAKFLGVNPSTVRRHTITFPIGVPLPHLELGQIPARMAGGRLLYSVVDLLGLTLNVSVFNAQRPAQIEDSSPGQDWEAAAGRRLGQILGSDS